MDPVTMKTISRRFAAIDNDPLELKSEVDGMKHFVSMNDETPYGT